MPLDGALRISKRHVYKPGQYAPVSGIYLVHHGTGHRPDHAATIIRAEELPACVVCKGNVKYSILQHATHITHDADLTAPTAFLLSKSNWTPTVNNPASAWTGSDVRIASAMGTGSRSSRTPPRSNLRKVLTE